MTAYYNEHDRFAAAWLRELIKKGLIADGEVDERDIQDVRPGDLAGFTQCHFFAGIGGWSYALRLAGWPDDRPVWTGSCPCQPFSSLSNRYNRRTNDERHLWPHWAQLISATKPRAVFGEQVAQAGDWFDGVCDDMEAMGYEVGAVILPAVAVGADHARARLYFVGDSHRHGEPKQPVHAEASRLPWCGCQSESVAFEDGLPARVDIMRGYGNAIVPQVAAEVIAAYMEVAQGER